MAVRFYQIYFPKLHENILKNYRLNLFKINYHWLQSQPQDDDRISRKPSFLFFFLFAFSVFKIGKCNRYLYLQLIFCVALKLVGHLLNRTEDIIIQGIAIWGVRWPYVRGDMIAEILVWDLWPCGNVKIHWRWFMKGPKALGTISVNSIINSNLKPKLLSGNEKGF